MEQQAIVEKREYAKQYKEWENQEGANTKDSMDIESSLSSNMDKFDFDPTCSKATAQEKNTKSTPGGKHPALDLVEEQRTKALSFMQSLQHQITQAKMGVQDQRVVSPGTVVPSLAPQVWSTTDMESSLLLGNRPMDCDSNSSIQACSETNNATIETTWTPQRNDTTVDENENQLAIDYLIAALSSDSYTCTSTATDAAPMSSSLSPSSINCLPCPAFSSSPPPPPPFYGDYMDSEWEAIDTDILEALLEA